MGPARSGASPWLGRRAPGGPRDRFETVPLGGAPPVCVVSFALGAPRKWSFGNTRSTAETEGQGSSPCGRAARMGGWMPEALALVGPRLRAPAGGAARLRGQASSVFIRDRSRERGRDCYSKSRRMLLRLLAACNFLISTAIGAEDPRRRYLSGLGSPRDMFPSSKAGKELGRQHAERKTKTQRALSLARLFLPPSSDRAQKNRWRFEPVFSAACGGRRIGGMLGGTGVHGVAPRGGGTTDPDRPPATRVALEMAPRPNDEEARARHDRRPGHRRPLIRGRLTAVALLGTGRDSAAREERSRKGRQGCDSRLVACSCARPETGSGSALVRDVRDPCPDGGRDRGQDARGPIRQFKSLFFHLHSRDRRGRGRGHPASKWRCGSSRLEALPRDRVHAAGAGAPPDLSDSQTYAGVAEWTNSLGATG
jgi:hypothetical protein